RDVLARGALIPEERGLLYRNKPPLFPWSIAVLSWPAGHVNETTALVPVAAGACLAILGTFLLRDALFWRRARLWAGMILATRYGFCAFAQRPLPDMLVVGLVTLAGYPLWRAVGPAARRPALVGFYALLAIGVFAKGPEGLLPLLVALVWCGATAGTPGLRRLWSPAGLAVFVAISLLWGPLLWHAGDRLAGDVVEPGLWAYLGLPRPVSLAGQLVRFALGFLPWTLVAPLAMSAAARRGRTPAVGFALSWFVVPLAVVFLSHTQRTRYLLPLYPGAALLVAWWAASAGDRVTPIRPAGAVAAARLPSLVVLAAPLWVRPSPRYFVPAATWASAPLLLGLLSAGAALAAGLWRGRPRLLVAGTVTAMVVVLGCGSWLHARWAASTQDYPGLAAEVEREAGGGPGGAGVICARL